MQRPSGFKLYDSMAVESDGNVCAATMGDPHGITVVSPDGAEIDFVPTPDILTINIYFGGKDLRTAYITLSGTGCLIATEWPRPGLTLHHLTSNFRDTRYRKPKVDKSYVWVLKTRS